MPASKIRKNHQRCTPCGLQLGDQLPASQNFRAECVCFAWKRRALALACGRCVELRLEISNARLNLGLATLRAQRGEVGIVDVLSQRVERVVDSRLGLCELCALECASGAKCWIEDSLLGAQAGVVGVMRRRRRALSAGKYDWNLRNVGLVLSERVDGKNRQPLRS